MTHRRVRIVQLDTDTLAALADGDLARARRTTPVELTEWLAGPECSGCLASPRPSGRRDAPGRAVGDRRALGRRRAVVRSGRAGFHAAPDADGMVEVGYAVDPAYRGGATPAPRWRP